MKTGIVKVDYDKRQPYRVYWRNKIIWFARTLGEAELKLSEEKFSAGER